MKKIPTIYLRYPATKLRYLTREPHPACEWVFAGEGVPTRKYDGLCLMIDAKTGWYRRRTVKPSQTVPADFVEIDRDPVTDIAVGWVPLGAGKNDVLAWETIERTEDDLAGTREQPLSPGTYELCGPQVNGNPEAMPEHRLICHAAADYLPGIPDPADWDALAAWLHAHLYEGIVWHHPDGRMAKIKRKDFPR